MTSFLLSRQKYAVTTEASEAFALSRYMFYHPAARGFGVMPVVTPDTFVARQQQMRFLLGSPGPQDVTPEKRMSYYTSLFCRIVYDGLARECVKNL